MILNALNPQAWTFNLIHFTICIHAKETAGPTRKNHTHPMYLARVPRVDDPTMHILSEKKGGQQSVVYPQDT